MQIVAHLLLITRRAILPRTYLNQTKDLLLHSHTELENNCTCSPIYICFSRSEVHIIMSWWHIRRELCQPLSQDYTQERQQWSPAQFRLGTVLLHSVSLSDSSHLLTHTVTLHQAKCHLAQHMDPTAIMSQNFRNLCKK